MTAAKQRHFQSRSAKTEAVALHERDLLIWPREQGALLRAGRVDEADLPNVADEIETLSRSEAAAETGLVAKPPPSRPLVAMDGVQREDFRPAAGAPTP